MRYEVFFGYKFGHDEWSRGEFDTVEEAKAKIAELVNRTCHEDDGYYYVRDHYADCYEESFVDGTWVDVERG